MAKHQGDGRVLYLCEIGSLLPKDTLREGNGRKLRSTPIPWLKFRTPADTSPEGTRYAMRRRAVKAQPQGMAMLGIYDEMLAIYGGDRIAPLRGYVVNHHLRAASVAEIAMEIGCQDLALLEAAIAELLEECLLAWRPRPDFKAAFIADKTLAPHDDPPDEPDDTRVADDSRAVRCAPRQRARAKTGSAKGRKRPKNRLLRLAGNCRGTGSQVASQAGGDLRHKTGDVKRETPETPDGTAADAAAQPPPPCPEPGDGKTPDLKAETETPSASPPGLPTVNERQDDAPQGTQDAASGPQDDESTEDGATPAPTGRLAQPTRSASASVDPTKTDPGGSQARLVALGDGGIDILVQKVMDLLYPSHDDLVLQGRRHVPPQNADLFEACERGCLATAWTAVSLLDLPPMQMMHLADKAEKHALATRREKCKTTRGRKWMMWLNYHMKDLVGPRWETARRLARRGPSGPP